ncbi:MAG: FecR domain-containing protein [Proteobacteria bacterium]|nr:FecR domain-containing protein [Pseudomonadota bacterium]
MKLYVRKTLVFAAIVALTLQPVLAQAQVAVGNANKIVSGVRGVWQSNTRTLNLKDEVFSNEQVNTDADSAARFIFRDDTLLSIGASSSVTLDKFVFDNDASKSQVALSMSKGVMRFVSGNLPKNLYSIRTPAALIGIRGTILVITVALNGVTSVSVIEGAATVTALGTTTTVNAGFSTSVTPGAPPAPPTGTPPTPPQVQAMQTALGPDPGIATGGQAATGLGGLSTGALVGAAALAAVLAVAISAASSDNDSAVGTTNASSSTSTATSQ